MKTLKKHFEVYKKECLKWMNKLSLKSWEPYFEHNAPEGMENVLAALARNKEAHCARFYFNTEWSEPINDAHIRKCARHEVFELLLFNLAEMASYSFNDEAVNGETHKIINRLEGAL